MSPRGSRRLRALLAGPGIVVAPGVHDALGARVAQAEGFRSVYMSGNPTLGSTWLSVVGTVLAAPVAAALAVILDEVRRAVAATGPSAISVGQAARAEERRSAARPGASGPWWAFWRT